jgi:hypothetical protein
MSCIAVSRRIIEAIELKPIEPVNSSDSIRLRLLLQKDDKGILSVTGERLEMCRMHSSISDEVFDAEVWVADDFVTGLLEQAKADDVTDVLESALQILKKHFSL